MLSVIQIVLNFSAVDRGFGKKTNLLKPGSEKHIELVDPEWSPIDLETLTFVRYYMRATYSI